MAPVDLHLHSTASDGSSAPSEVVARAAAREVRVIALCDHDSVGGVAEAVAAGAAVGVRVLSGVELTCYWRGRSIHLLGYGFDPTAPALLADLAARRAVRQRHIDRILDRLTRLGAAVSRQRVLELAGDGVVGRPHIARALVEAGHTEDTRQSFGLYLGKGKPAYLVPAEPQSPVAAIDLLHRVGAVAVLAHPALDHALHLLPELAAAGLDGLEAWHPAQPPAVAEALVQDAARLGLLVTGGSDNHGPERPPDIGEVSLSPELLAPLETALAARAAARAT